MNCLPVVGLDMVFYRDCGFGVKWWGCCANRAHGTQEWWLGVSARFLVVGLSQERQDILRYG